MSRSKADLGDGSRLSRARILDEAVRIVTDEGPRALTMRRLGEELGVAGMALYRYVRSREELLDALVDRVVDQVLDAPEMRSVELEDWRAFLTRMAHAVRAIAVEQPGVFPLVATHPPAAPWLRPPLRSLRWVEELLAGLVARGFADQGAVAAYRAFSSFLLGHLLLEVSGRGVQAGPVRTDPVSSEQARAELADYPALSRLQQLLGKDHAKAEFQASLTSLLDRLERLNGLPQTTEK